MLPLRFIATPRPLRLSIVRRPTNVTLPPLRVTWLDVVTTRAVPPMWKVRIVSCVPGSPIDCAATTPTASPIRTSSPRERSRP